jgi:ISXO2 transposase-like protein
VAPISTHEGEERDECDPDVAGFDETEGEDGDERGLGVDGSGLVVAQCVQSRAHLLNFFIHPRPLARLCTVAPGLEVEQLAMRIVVGVLGDLVGEVSGLSILRSEDGDGVRGALCDRGGLSRLLDRGALGRRAGLRPLQQHPCMDDPRRHDVRVRGLRPSDEPDLRHAAREDQEAPEDVVRAVFEISTRRTGISAKDLQRIMGFGSYKTAWTWLHKLRAAMVRPDREPLGPFAQVDETLVGGKGSPNKELILVAAEVDGRVRLAHADNNDEGTLKSFADSQIASDAQVVTDGLASYNSASLGERPHQAIVQTKQERREGDALQGCHWRRRF